MVGPSTISHLSGKRVENMRVLGMPGCPFGVGLFSYAGKLSATMFYSEGIAAHEIFKEFGEIEYCTLVMDPKSGSSKGFGFIEMPNANEAKAAIKNLSYKTVGRNKIRVKTTKN